MKNLLSVITLTAALTLLSSCASMSDVLKSKEEGTSKTYAVNFDQAWDISKTVLRWEDCEQIEEQKNDGYMLTTINSFLSGGTLIGVWVESSGGNSKVTVVTKRKNQTQMLTGLSESGFHERFAQAVDIVKSGNTLPVEAP
jgi:hypothetical protein